MLYLDASTRPAIERTDDVPAASTGRSATIRSRLFQKYIALFVLVVSLALLANGLLDVWFSYQEHRAAWVRIQHDQAEAAAAKIAQFIKEIEAQLGWTTQLPWAVSSIEQRRFDARRLLRQVPAITELAQLDGSGKERLRVSRLAMDVLDSNTDYSEDAKFTEPISHKTYYGPIYFRRDSEPYITLAVAGARRDAGVSVAEVNLKLIWDVVSQIKVGERGQAFVVDKDGRLIAHPDISLVLRGTDLGHLPQVRSARFPDSGKSPRYTQIANDLHGQTVLSAFATVTPLNWRVFVELPTSEAYAPLYASIRRTLIVLFGALVLAAVSGFFLARRMVGPIRTLQTGAARIGNGDLSQRIAIKTGDELETLASTFNEMAGRLQESYADLENKVAVRTRELAQSLQELRALDEVSQAVNSTLELEKVLSTIVANAVQISGTDAGAIYAFDQQTRQFSLRATCGLDEVAVRTIRQQAIGADEPQIAAAIAQRDAVQIADLNAEPPSPINELLLRSGFRALLIAPLLRSESVVGLLVVRRKEPGSFSKNIFDLIRTFAAQSVIAIHNARLFSEIEDKSRQLERELEAARVLQLGMLPQVFPKSTHEQPVEVHALMEPAREVGGDLYDCFYASQGLFCFLVGDVSGKGAPAAMFMARTRSLVRLAVELWRDLSADSISPASIALMVNRELCQNNHEHMFVTIFLALLDTATGELTYVNAGHPAPRLVRSSGAVERVNGRPEMPIGARQNAIYRSRTQQLIPGDAVVVVTDGVIEAINAEGDFFTPERLDQELDALRDASPETDRKSVV